MGHEGSWVGFTTALYRNLEKRTLLVILDNASNIEAVDLIAEQAKPVMDAL